MLTEGRGALGHYTAFDKTVWVLASINGNQIITQELPITFAGPMTSDPQQGIWLGTDRGLLYADGKDLRLGLLKDLDACVGLSYVDEIAVDREGRAWALTAFDGVYTLPPGALQWQSVADFTRTNPKSANEIVSIAVAEDGGVWATHGYDLFRLDNPQAMPLPLPGDCRINIDESGKLIAKAGHVWGTGAFCGLLEFDVANMTWSLYPWMNVPAGLVDVGTDGTVYALSQGGLYTFHPGASDGPDSQWVRVAEIDADRLAADRANGVWLASNQEGRLWYYKNFHLATFNAPFRKFQIPHLAVDNQNRLWIATTLLQSQPIVYDGHGFRQVTIPLRSISTWTIAPDNHIWTSSDGIIAVYDPALDPQP